MNPPVNLSGGTILMMNSGESQVADMNPVLQVADIRLVNTAAERYRILLSDGEFSQQGVLATQQLNDLVRSQQLQKGSIIRLTQFVCDVIQSSMIVIVIKLDVILQKCDLIGMPKQFPAPPMANQSRMFQILPGKMNQPVSLSKGAISMMTNCELLVLVTDMMPVLQVADIRLVNTASHERYRTLLSDGEFLQQGILVTQLNDLVRSQQLQKGSIIRLTQFVCNVIMSRMIIVVIELDVIHH